MIAVRYEATHAALAESWKFSFIFYGHRLVPFSFDLFQLNLIVGCLSPRFAPSLGINERGRRRSGQSAAIMALRLFSDFDAVGFGQGERKHRPILSRSRVQTIGRGARSIKQDQTAGTERIAGG